MPHSGTKQTQNVHVLQIIIIIIDFMSREAIFRGLFGFSQALILLLYSSLLSHTLSRLNLMEWFHAITRYLWGVQCTRIFFFWIHFGNINRLMIESSTSILIVIQPFNPTASICECKAKLFFLAALLYASSSFSC